MAEGNIPIDKNSQLASCIVQSYANNSITIINGALIFSKLRNTIFVNYCGQSGNFIISLILTTGAGGDTFNFNTHILKAPSGYTCTAEVDGNNIVLTTTSLGMDWGRGFAIGLAA